MAQKDDKRCKIAITISKGMKENVKTMQHFYGDVTITETLRSCIRVAFKSFNKERFGYSGADVKVKEKSMRQKEDELFAMSDAELIDHLTTIGYLPEIGSPWPSRPEDYVYREFFCQGAGKERNVYFTAGTVDDPKPSENMFNSMSAIIKELKGKELI